MSGASILLLQARHGHDPALREERASFAAKLRVTMERIVPWDLLSGTPSLEQVSRHGALMVGGSGEFYVSRRDLPDFEGLMELLRNIVETGHPTFASCFGFQCMVVALGGEIIHDAANPQVGTYRLNLTEEGRRDELLGTLPHRFPAQLGRKDRAAQLPPGALNLATCPECPYQALRIPGKPIWATQFHPELNGDENRLRFHRYLDGYAAHMSPEEQQATLERFSDSPETEKLLPRFLELVSG